MTSLAKVSRVTWHLCLKNRVTATNARRDQAENRWYGLKDAARALASRSGVRHAEACMPSLEIEDFDHNT